MSVNLANELGHHPVVMLSMAKWLKDSTETGIHVDFPKSWVPQ